MGFLSSLANDVLRQSSPLTPRELEGRLELPYNTVGLASMACNRYPVAPVISDYKETIGESIKAHFLGLHHVAVAGLVPVIEGAGRRLLEQRGLNANGVKNVFIALANDCKRESAERNMGAVGEIESMMDSFSHYTSNYLYVDSAMYPLVDKTNRHGITHGAYADRDYGSRLNFYKTIGAVDFLTFISSFRANISWLAPDTTPASTQLASFYAQLNRFRHPG